MSAGNGCRRNRLPLSRTVIPLIPTSLIGSFPDSTTNDAEAAIAAAKHAYDSWRLVPAPKRAEILFKAAQLIATRKEEFARDMTREMGKVLEETRGDVQEAIDMTYFLAAEGRRLHGQTAPSELRDKFAMSIRQPIGVCSMITPWNFPMAIPSWKIVPALVCGNTVVLKPSELTPLSALNFVKVLEEAGVPPGVVNMVTGGPSVGETLTTHPDVSVVSFTGSTAVGKLVNQNAAPHFKKVHLEMGGKNAIMVMDDANLELALEGCLWGGFGTTGQRCTAASRVIVHEKVHDRFVEQFVTARDRAAGRRRPRCRHADGPVDQREAAAEGDGLRRDWQAGGRDARLRRSPADIRRARQRLLSRAYGLHRRDAGDADRARRDLRAGRLDHQVLRQSTRPWRSPTTLPTGCLLRFTRKTSIARIAPCAMSTPASSM